MPMPRSAKTIDTPDVLQSLHNELKAARLEAEARFSDLQRAADARHVEILAALSECNKRCEEKSKCIDAGGNLFKGDGDQRSTTKGTSKSYNEVAKDLTHSFQTQRNSGAPNAERIVHLSKHSQFQFGTKWTSEASRGGKSLHARAKAAVENDTFESIVAALIVGNALAMSFEIQYVGKQVGFELQYEGYNEEAHLAWPGAKHAFSFSDWLFGVLFSLEACIKLTTFGLSYFHDLFNWIDFGCVLAFLTDKIASALADSAIDAQVFRLIRLFRLMRLLRVIRSLELLDVLYVMTTALQGMSMVICWAVFLLSLILMACALFLSEFLQATYFKGIDVTGMSPADLATHKDMFKYFGTFSRCMMSMFELTLANWPPVTRLLTEEVSEWFWLLGVLHKLTFGVAVVGVINGVIFQETFKVAQTDDVVMYRQKVRESRGLRRKMEKLFQALDLDCNGHLQFPEFMVIAAQPDVQKWLQSLNIDTDDLLTLFIMLDKDCDGNVTLEELISQAPRLRGAARAIDMIALRKDIPNFTLYEEEPEDPVSNERKFKWAASARESREFLESVEETFFTMDTAIMESERSHPQSASS